MEKLLVKKGAKVTAGQPLFILDQQPEHSSVKQLEAQLEKAKAEERYLKSNVRYNETILKRRETLAKKEHLSEESLDVARIKHKRALEDLKVVHSEIRSIQANLHKAKWTKKQKTVNAKHNGLVFDTYFLPSEFVLANKPVLSLLYKNETKVIFFLPEKYLSQIHLGQ